MRARKGGGGEAENLTEWENQCYNIHILQPKEIQNEKNAVYLFGGSGRHGGFCRRVRQGEQGRYAEDVYTA
jgi:hypothetical protein